MNALSGKPDGGEEKSFGKPNDFERACGLIRSRATSHALAFADDRERVVEEARRIVAGNGG
jgi:hypothetical protein